MASPLGEAILFNCVCYALLNANVKSCINQPNT